MSHFDICFVQKEIFFTFFGAFFGIFLTLPPKTIKSINLICSMRWPWKIGLWTCISYLFFKLFLVYLSQCIYSDPPSPYRVKCVKTFQNNEYLVRICGYDVTDISNKFNWTSDMYSNFAKTKYSHILTKYSPILTKCSLF